MPRISLPAMERFTDAQVRKWAPAMALRYACRSFEAPPRAPQWSALSFAASRACLPGVRIALGMCEPALFQPPIVSLFVRITNAQRFAAVILRDDKPETRVAAGISGELFVLEGYADGVASVWVAGSYRKGGTGLKLDAGEKIAALIALGQPADALLPVTDRARKPVEKLCADFDAFPDWAKAAANAVRSAPSALNVQPWRMAMSAGALEIAAKPAFRLDLGIGAAHALLVLRQKGLSPDVTLAEDGASLRIRLR